MLGKGGAQILSGITKLGSLSATASELQMSYQFVWRYVRRMEDRLGKPIIVSRRGGTPHGARKGGGGATLTPVARALLKEYKTIEERMRKQIPNSKREPTARRH